MKNTGDKEHSIYDEFNSERTAKYTVLNRSNLALFYQCTNAVQCGAGHQ